MPRFAANLSMMFNEVPFLDRFEAAAKAGFTAVEFLFPYDHPAEEVGKRLRGNGLTQALFNLPPGNWDAGEKGFAALPERFDDLQQSLRTALPYAQATGVKRLHLMAGIASRSNAKAVEAFYKSVAWTAEFFAPHGLDVVIEPINSRNVPGYFLNDFSFARDLINELKIPESETAVRYLSLPDHPWRRHHAAARDDADHRPCPDRQHPVAQRARWRGAELSVPVRRARPARLWRFCRLRIQPARQDDGWPRLVQALRRSKAVTLALGCIADDYTGASDLANTLTRCGLRTVQTIGVPSDDLALPEVDAVVVSLKSRSIEAGLAVSRSRAAEKWLRDRGAGHVLFKICSTFDSTDAGNIGPVMDALRADSGDAIVLVTPAFPETGRTVYQGNLFVGSVPLNESPLKDHPLNPMHDSNLVRVLARQSKTKVGLVELAVLTRGRRCGAGAAGRSCRQGSLGPSSSMPCSTAISKPSARWRWIIGSPSARPASGLASPVRWWPPAESSRTRRTRLPARRSADRRRALPAVVRRRPCARSPSAEAVMPVLRLDPDQVVAGKEEVRRALAWAGERLARGPVLIASSSTPDQVAALQSRHGRDATGHAIEQAMADIAEGLVQSGVRRLVVAGGETSGAVVDRLRIPGFLVGEEIAAGVPVLRAVGAEGGDMLLALKSGNFGGTEFFSDALKLMR